MFFFFWIFETTDSANLSLQIYFTDFADLEASHSMLSKQLDAFKGLLKESRTVLIYEASEEVCDVIFRYALLNLLAGKFSANSAPNRDSTHAWPTWRATPPSCARCRPCATCAAPYTLSFYVASSRVVDLS